MRAFTPQSLPILPRLHRPSTEPDAVDGRRIGAADRYAAWRRREALDDALAAGIDPRRGAALALRAGQIGSARYRARLAAEIDGVLASTRLHAARTSPCDLEICREEVEVARDALTELAERLWDRRPVDSRGVAMTARLLRDPASPMFSGAPNDALWRAVRAARRALDATPDRP
jgi:hypothetical protein